MSLTHACHDGQHGSLCGGTAHTGMHCLTPGVPCDCAPCTCPCHGAKDMFSPGDPAKHYKRPSRGYAGDAGYDLYAAHDTIVNPGQTVNVDVNVRVDFPVGWFGLIAERSSQGAAGISTLGNVIDETYTGVISVNVHNSRREAVIVHRGEKVGQLLFILRFIDPLEAKLPLRGDRGFGSTGR